MYLGDRLSPGFALAFVDDCFVRLDQVLDRVGIGLKALSEGHFE